MVTVDDFIGRRDNIGKAATTRLTVSGTVVEVTAGLPRHDYIKIANTGAVDAVIFTTPSGDVNNGFRLTASGGYLEDKSTAPLYVVSTGAVTTIDVFESFTIAKK